MANNTTNNTAIVLEVGKWYTTRNGNCVHVIEYTANWHTPENKFFLALTPLGFRRMYRADGTNFYEHYQSPDAVIVAGPVDEPVKDTYTVTEVVVRTYTVQAVGTTEIDNALQYMSDGGNPIGKLEKVVRAVHTELQGK